MLSPRRIAQLGLTGAVVVFASCFAVLARNAAVDRKVLAAHPGNVAPAFALPAATGPGGRPVALVDCRGSVVVLCFSSIRCPVSNDYDRRVAELFDRYGRDDGTGAGPVKFLGVHSGAAAASPVEVSVQTAVAGLEFPQLLDADRSVAERYAVTLTPTFVVIDPSGVVRYRGGLDDNRTRELATIPYLDRAIRAVVEGRPVPQPLADVKGCAVR